MALGGGGARGAVHIGFLAEMEELGLWPDLVTGTSIGGLVGALVAAGLNADEMVDVFRQMRFGRMYSLPWNRPAMMNTDRLERMLVRAIGRPAFADLKLPLALMATDLVSRESVVLHSGEVVSAVLATTAFPVVLPPVQREGRLLIDGGVLNNTPFDVARQMGAEYVLAIDLAGSAPYGTPVPFPPRNNVLTRLLTRAQRDPLYQAVSVMADIITASNVDNRVRQQAPDLFVRPELGSIGLFDFHRLEEGLAAGRAAARSVMPELRRLARLRANG
jgi:NTE family protein